MIGRRLDELLETDIRSRWRIISISALAFALWGGLASELTDKPTSEVHVGALAFAVVVFSAQVLLYCLRTKEQPVGHMSVQAPRRLFMTAITAAVILLVATVPAPVLEGAIIDRRLRQLTKTLPLSYDAINKVTETLREADLAQAKLSNQTKEAVRSALKETTESAIESDPHLFALVMSAEVALASYSTNSASSALNEQLAKQRLRNEAIGKSWNFVPIANNKGADNYQLTEVAPQPDVARMERIDTPVPPSSDYGPSFLIVQGLEAGLDGFNLKRIIFRNMKLIYRGGPLILEQVYFLDCNLEFELTPNSLRLVALITSSGPFYFVAS